MYLVYTILRKIIFTGSKIPPLKCPVRCADINGAGEYNKLYFIVFLEKIHADLHVYTGTWCAMLPISSA